MKIRALFPFLVVVFFVLTGCEGSKYPLSDPSESSVEEHFIGSWIYESPDGEDASYLTMLAFNDHEYYGVSWELGDEDEMMMMGIFSTTVNGVTFASIRLLGTEEEDESYFFFKYELASEDELTVYAIDDDQYEELSELESVAAVRQFFEERMSEPDFFNEEFGTYRKLEERIWPWEVVYPNFGK